MRVKRMLMLFIGFIMVGCIVYGNLQQKPLPAQRVEAPALATTMSKAEVTKLVHDKCISCHTSDFELPLFAANPDIREIVESGYSDGLRALDLRDDFGEKANDRPVNEATLAKMEWVTLHESMPLDSPWGSELSHQERADILNWVKAERAQYYATGTAAPDRANEPVQPIPDSLSTDANKVALGLTLFNDTRLSADNSISCHSCHELDKAGTDNARFAEGINRQKGDVNSPTVFNAVFNFRQFWDGRVATLHEQVAGPPFNPVEMGSKDWQQILGKLQEDEDLSAKFTAVYADGWTPQNIQDAISEYERTLITPNSRFDKWLKGDVLAISVIEADGYQLFKDYRCATCHVGKALGGQSYEYMDLKKDYFKDRGGVPLDSDAGRKNHTAKDEHKHLFKVPNLRNIELTAPYLHDGTVESLDESVRIMGLYLAGITIPEQSRDSIVAFLRTLTGEYQGEKLKGFVSPK
ncbi:cytochrome-c peroxidase [Desulfovibrio sp. OttesenSCG-928-M14]|nr:cytochrome-c peroxidase [Desulfovibrio sp. OttesenSCG-928-M14]